MFQTRAGGIQIAGLDKPDLAMARGSQSLHDRSRSGVSLQRTIGNQAMMFLAQSRSGDSFHPHGSAVVVPSEDAQGPPKSQPSNITVNQLAPSGRLMRTPAEPYVEQITVDLNTSQNVTLGWRGTAPDGARSTFRCSTGKGYGDPGDPPGICTRACCSPGVNPCESPYDQKRSRGSCCTPVGNFVIQSKEREHAVEGGTIPFWMFFYQTRGIAIHEYSPVDGTPLSHGCVRLDSVNAEMLFNYSHAGVTRVTVSGAATPACPAGNGVACGSSASTEPASTTEERLASTEKEETDAGV